MEPHDKESADMGAQEKAVAKGLDLSPIEHRYLAMCVQTGSLIITSGHVSTLRGVVGAGVTVEEGYAAARDCAEKILRSVHDHHGSLDGLRVLKLLGAVYSAPDFTDQHLVINGASDLLHELFGPDLGHHARSALGFAALPTGVAVEIEAIFEVI
jgi:enamine deaminase RidA (YjgF/YER057c/UK114 family)